MNLHWSDQEKAFQAEVRTFLEENLTEDLKRAGRWMTSVYADHDASMQWQQILHEKGWAAPAWPVEYGGCDWSQVQHYIFASEKARAGAPPTSPMGIQMCAPAIIAFGTEQQKQFYLPRMLSGEHFWCQGYSEPESGSDLASLQMRAEEDGENLICNGAKIWQTHANEANWIFCLVRTSQHERPQQGITFLLIDMNTPGVEVKPIVSLTGEHIQNQVFFTDVRVPKANVIGEIDKGWTVAKYLLEFERGGSAYAPLMQVRLAEIREFAAQVPGNSCDRLVDDTLFASRLAELEIAVDVLEIYELECLAKLHQGQSPGLSASVMKTRGTELQQAVTELALEATAQQGLRYVPEDTCPGGPISYPAPAARQKPTTLDQFEAVAPLRYFNERAGTIYAGSNEIQRNILAKAGLGLG